MSELRNYAAILWKWKLLIVLMTTVAGLFAYWGSLQMPRVYRSTTTVLVGEFLRSASPQLQDFQASQQLAQTYVQIARRRPILEATIEALDLKETPDTLTERVSATLIPGTQLIEISAADTDPQRAREIASELAQQIVLQRPTGLDQIEERQLQFVSQQLVNLQTRIDDAGQQLALLQDKLAAETDPQTVNDVQTQLSAQQDKITSLQSTYAGLISLYRGTRTNYLSVVEPAALPTRPVSPQIPLNVLVGLTTGFILAVCTAFLIEQLDRRLKTPADVSGVLSLRTLGAIPSFGPIRSPADRLIALRHPLSPSAEAYRILLTNLHMAPAGRPSSVLITSPLGGEGKTTTACNLAITLAQLGRKVVLVDADLRQPTIHQLFGLPVDVGLTDLLRDSTLSAEDVLIETDLSGLLLLPGGSITANPAELLGFPPKQLQERVVELKQLANVIVLDGPPALSVADTAVLCTACDAVVLVVDAQRTSSDVAIRGLAALQQIGVPILGAVLNRTKRTLVSLASKRATLDGTAGLGQISTPVDVAVAMRWAAENNARVTSMSLASAGPSDSAPANGSSQSVHPRR